MNISEVIFTSYCFGDEYINQQKRLMDSILKVYPNANLHFLNESEEVGKPKFQQSLYGFKVKMIQQCIDLGYKKIIYFDTAICLEREVDEWFDLCETYGFLAVWDRQSLADKISDNCLSYFAIDRESIRPFKLCGGSVYVLDLNNARCRHVWNKWKVLEENGLFGTQDDLSNDRLQGHRMDEACLGLCFMMAGTKPLQFEEMHYAYEHSIKGMIGDKNPIIIKRHFK